MKDLVKGKNSRGVGTGRQYGLKIHWLVRAVRVQLPPPAPNLPKADLILSKPKNLTNRKIFDAAKDLRTNIKDP